MKKICYIGYETFFGPDKALMALLASEHQVTFHCIQSNESWISNDEIQNVSENSGLTGVPIMHKARRRSVKQFFYYLKLMRKVLAENYDIIFIVPEHNIYLSLLAPIFLKRNKTIIAFHDVVPHLNDSNYLKNLSLDMYKFFFSNFHFFSKTQMKIFKQHFPDKSCSYSSLIFDEDSDLILPKESKSSLTNFLFFGGIKYYKGLDILLAASEQLYSEGITNFRLTIAGSGDYWDQCKKIMKHPEIYHQHVRFIDEKEIPSFFAAADFLVLPYRDVTQSGPLALSHHFNLPAVGSRHDGFEEHIENAENGYLFTNEDIEDLAKVMKQAIRLSNEDYMRMKKNLLQYTTDLYDTHQTLQAFSSVFQNLS